MLVPQSTNTYRHVGQREVVSPSISTIITPAFTTEEFARNTLSGYACSHGADSAELEDMFCPQDEPVTCIGTYVVKQNDMDTGSYGTTSNVTAVSPNGSHIEDITDHSAGLIGAAGISIGERDPPR